MVSEASLLHPMIASNSSLSQHSDSIDTLNPEFHSPMFCVGGVMRSRPPAGGGTKARRSLSIAIRRGEHGKDLLDTSAAAGFHFPPGFMYLYLCSLREGCFSVVFEDRLPAGLQRCERTRGGSQEWRTATSRQTMTVSSVRNVLSNQGRDSPASRSRRSGSEACHNSRAATRS